MAFVNPNNKDPQRIEQRIGRCHRYGQQYDVVVVNFLNEASQAGIFLESLLDFLTILYQCKLPRKLGPFYTLGELLNGLDKKLRKSLKIIKSNGDSIDLAPLITAVEEKIWLRNQVGAHFNASGMDIADNDIKQMGKDTLEFANALICESCGQIPDNKKSGSYWECCCKKTQMHPLETPE